MAIFKIDCYDYQNGGIVSLTYDTSNSSLRYEDGNDVICQSVLEHSSVKRISSKKTKNVKNLRIVLGTKCNYKCSYCSQAFVEGEESGSKLSDVDVFLARLDEWVYSEPHRIELWGGEPLVYIKHLKKIIPELRKKYPNSTITTITNGSLLSDEIVDFFIENNVIFSISHDSYGQSIRGEDILKSGKIVRIVKRANDLINNNSEIKTFGFNAVYSKSAYDPIKMKEYFTSVIGEDIPLSADPVLSVGRANEDSAVLLNDSELNEFSRNIATASVLNVDISSYTIFNYIKWFLASIENGENINAIRQKCNVGYDDSLIVDLLGNVYTCQNYVKKNDIKGSVYDFDNININNLFDIDERKSCKTCPFVHMCRGGCPVTNGNSFAKTCRVKFAYFSGIFVGAIFKATHMIPLKITSDKDIILPVSEIVETKHGKFERIKSFDLPRIDLARCAKYCNEKNHERILGLNRETQSPET